MNKKNLILTIVSLAIMFALGLGVRAASADNSLRLHQGYVIVQGFGAQGDCEAARLSGDYCEYDEDANAWWLYRNNTPPPTPVPTLDAFDGFPNYVIQNRVAFYQSLPPCQSAANYRNAHRGENGDWNYYVCYQRAQDGKSWLFKQ